MRLRPSVTALALALFGVLAAACSSSSKSSTSVTTVVPAATSSSVAATGGPTIASKLVLGGPAECKQNPLCIPGLTSTYGITFKDFKTLDADGPLTYQALQSGAIDVGEVFSTDAQVAADGLVVLNDDKHLQAADAVVPFIRTNKATAGVSAVINRVSAALTTDILLGLNKSVGVDKKDPQAVADAWLKDKGLDATSTTASGSSLHIAGFNFAESNLLAYVYGDALKAAGATVKIDAALGTRQTLEPGLESGSIDLLLEYAASALKYFNKDATPSGDISANVSQLNPLIQAKGITALTPSTAIDTNAFAVTKATAQKYNLTNMSDLAKSAS